MKKSTCFLMGLLLLFGFSACTDAFDTDSFDKSLIYGHWQEGTVHERYYSSSVDFILPSGETIQANGITWDTSDDVGEDEGQAFEWSLSGSTLTHQHVGTFSIIPKLYTVTELTSDRLSYVDDYGTSHDFNKVN